MIILVAQIQGPEKNRNGACYLKATVNVSRDWTQEPKWLVLCLVKYDSALWNISVFVAIVIYCWDGVVQGYRVLMLSLYLFESGTWCAAHCKVCTTHSGVGSLQPLIRQESHTHKVMRRFSQQFFPGNVVSQVSGWRSVQLVAVVHSAIYWVLIGSRCCFCFCMCPSLHV